MRIAEITKCSGLIRLTYKDGGCSTVSWKGLCIESSINCYIVRSYINPVTKKEVVQYLHNWRHVKKFPYKVPYITKLLDAWEASRGGFIHLKMLNNTDELKTKPPTIVVTHKEQDNG